MKKYILTAILCMSTSAMAEPPPGLSSAVQLWAGQKSVERYQFALVDLNVDGDLDAVVYVTDPKFCRDGGCTLVIFAKDSGAFKVHSYGGSNGRRPSYLLEDVRYGWRGLATYYPLGKKEILTPDYLGSPPGAAPVATMMTEVPSTTPKKALEFEEVP
jgi:hypothetical protein